MEMSITQNSLKQILPESRPATCVDIIKMTIIINSKNIANKNFKKTEKIKCKFISIHRLKIVKQLLCIVKCDSLTV